MGSVQFNKYWRIVRANTTVSLFVQRRPSETNRNVVAPGPHHPGGLNSELNTLSEGEYAWDAWDCTLIFCHWKRAFWAVNRKCANLRTYKICYICGPSASGAICGPSVGVAICVLATCGTNLFAICDLCTQFFADLKTSENSLFFSLQIYTLNVQMEFLWTKNSAKQTCGRLLSSLTIKGGNFIKDVSFSLSHGGKFADLQFVVSA